MRIVRPRDFIPGTAWDARDIARIDTATVRLQWTARPDRGHVNDSPEVFVVLDGTVQMRTRDADGERTHRLHPGDIFHAETGDAHVAQPLGPARVLVIERAGSV